MENEKTHISAVLLGMVFIVSTLNVIEFFEKISLLTIVTAAFCGFVCLEAFFYKNTNKIYSNGDSQDLTRSKYIKNVRNNNPIYSAVKSCQFYIPLFLIVISWASTIWSLNRGVTVTRNYAYTILPLFFVFVKLADFNEKDIKLIDNSIILAGLLYFVYAIVTHGVSGIISGRFSISEDFDQNATSAILFLIIVVMTKRIFDSRENSRKYAVYIVLLLPVLWLFLMTGSRGGLLALFAFITVIFLYGSEKKNKITKFVVAALIIFAVVYFVAPYVLPDSIYSRLFLIDSYKQTYYSGKDRAAIWKYCVQYIVPQTPIWGNGSGVPPYLIGHRFGLEYRGVHNMYLCMYMEYGLLALPLYIVFIANIFKSNIKTKNKYCVGALVGICIIAFFLESYSRTYLWNILAYCIIGIKVKDSERKESSENGNEKD